MVPTEEFCEGDGEGTIQLPPEFTTGAAAILLAAFFTCNIIASINFRVGAASFFKATHSSLSLSILSKAAVISVWS
jgi:hypothetical protein